MGDTIVSIIVAIVLGLTTIGLLLGLARKWKKALLRFGIVVIDLGVAFFGTNNALAAISAENVTVTGNPIIVELLTSIPSLFTLTGGLLKPMIFMICFLGSAIISLPIYLIISLFFGYAPKENTYPIAGMLIGGLQGLLVALVLVSPIVGYASLAEQTVASYKSVVGEEIPADVAEIYEKHIEPINKHPLVDAIDLMSAPIFSTLTTFDMNGDTFNPSEEIPLLIAMYHNATILMDVPPAEYGAEQRAAITNITSLFEQSTFLPNVGANVISAISIKWKENESFIGFEPIEVAGDFKPTVDSLYAVLSTTTPETLKGDVATLGDLVILMMDYNLTSLISDDRDVLAKVTAINPTTNKTFFRAATELLDTNPHLSVLRYAITALSADVFGARLGTPEKIRENYGDMVTSVVDVLKNAEGDSNEEKIEALTPAIKDGLAKNHINLYDGVVDEASRFLLEELEKDGVAIEDMTEEDIYNILDRMAAGETPIPVP